MLLQELDQINAIDGEIARLHQNLGELYKQRLHLLKDELPAESMLAQPRQTKVDESADKFRALVDIWQSYGVALPNTTNFKQKYHKALNLVAAMEQANPDIKGKFSVVTVPPSQQLESVLSKMPALAKKFGFVGTDLYRQSKTSRYWAVAILLDIQFSQPVYGLRNYLERKDYLYNQHDCRGLGVRQLIAAELQGVDTVRPGEASLLLNEEIKEDGSVLCTNLIADQILLDIEDSDCLLGKNHMQFAIEVK